jgi:outer membrane lipoprotein SlyB
VDSVRKVVIQGSQSGLGAVAGGVIGSTVDEKMTRKEADQEFQPGERVKLVTSGGITRVTP